MKIILSIFLSLILTINVSAQMKNNYNEFIESVKKELSQIKIMSYEEHFNEQYFIVNEQNEYFDIGGQIGLTNLYNICNQNDKSNWSEIINQHFELMKNTKKEEKDILPILENLESARMYIKFRIYPMDYLNYVEKSSIFDSRFTDFIGVVVIDLPSSVKNLDKSYLSKWSIGESEIIKLALDNTLKSNQETFEAYPISKSFIVNTLMSDENIFITSCVYDLISKSIPLGSFGSFVAIPNRLGIVTKTIEKKTLNTDLFQMISLVNYMYEQGPGSITNEIFWFNGKTLFRIDHNQEKKSIKLPQELVELIK